MGGRGSGSYCRYYTKTNLTTDYLALDMRVIGKTPWLHSKHYMTYSWNVSGNEQAQILMAAEKDCLKLRYTFTPSNGEPIEIVDYIPINKKSCNFGGERYYFDCPDCRKNVLLLYAGKYFRCRHCLGLVHPSVNESKLDRSIRSLRRYQHRLAPSASLSPFDGVRSLHKPKFMRYKTYFDLKFKGAEKEDAMLDLLMKEIG
ncbi:hypothetical protein [Aliiglaciecola sp. M165]|uniref:hypothetical protein n=1 Tax=Aliiglaciecola sp. M165 TaxID=2593649 RepID=UPI00118096C2|nr:hypothetical protein [Aliiglaciecola sp. M165]TRY30727.1 hypothetical protein FM019_12615 [Aliiglaciecola sp. M165]